MLIQYDIWKYVIKFKLEKFILINKESWLIKNKYEIRSEM